ncbi:hypothetical protein [Streptomyces sp. L2]|uniref:hypothetical protein n=1 Tax=Streptomyces sp. L2 TaxID=2162665 RepID=UPI0019D70ACC|nr:hypothetical protein [Streptomyces sp. L2]
MNSTRTTAVPAVGPADSGSSGSGTSSSGTSSSGSSGSGSSGSGSSGSGAGSLRTDSALATHLRATPKDPRR